MSWIVFCIRNQHTVGMSLIIPP